MPDPWVKNAADWATVAVAALALVQLLREFMRAHDERAAAKARVAFIAYGLRGQLLAWLTPDGSGKPALGRWARQVGTELKSHFDAAEARVDKMSALAPKLWWWRRRFAVQRVTILFFSGTKTLSEYVATVAADPIGTAFMTAIAARDLRELLGVLDARLIPSSMLVQERAIAKKAEPRFSESLKASSWRRALPVTLRGYRPCWSERRGLGRKNHSVHCGVRWSREWPVSAFGRPGSFARSPPAITVWVSASRRGG